MAAPEVVWLIIIDSQPCAFLKLATANGNSRVELKCLLACDARWWADRAAVTLGNAAAARHHRPASADFFRLALLLLLNSRAITPQSSSPDHPS
jgi:hypothetical protein